jgi:hypothetical protein
MIRKYRIRESDGRFYVQELHYHCWARKLVWHYQLDFYGAEGAYSPYQKISHSSKGEAVLAVRKLLAIDRQIRQEQREYLYLTAMSDHGQF